MEFITNILQVIIGLLIFYFIANRISGRSGKDFNKKLLKYLLILFSAAVAMNLVITFLNVQPDVVTQTIEQLKANPEIKRTIGKQTGYTFNSRHIDSIRQYPAVINITLHGTKAEVDLSVIVDSSANIFEVKEYKIEQLIEN
ncbi:hypothetical protein JAO76_16760 [Pontibacter sp. BT310]|uniref:DUF3290 domain-containing protein n=1 Tax=Pontibacter populi TaxID=890055 RepID=A0ABS6XFE5_9BACT|nr:MULTISPECIES: hypothetical protein [Pontibacter]MBJ6119860.1 hypothetical protein [Pontibacter sp. BT310]MBR0572289.1 hypothetical protein [Microvirga sp. STS03]MBW3366713.1 hypothetical protein [Pontibacter populi]